MRIAQLKTVLFALFLALPVATLLLFGSVEGFGREQPGFPKLEQMLRAKGRTQLGDAILERSAAMKLAVKLQTWIGYRLIGYVETTTVVSGRGGWLFYRPEFQDGACIEFDKVAVYFRQLQVLIDMAGASGLDMRVALSPNKSTIYPDELNPYMRGYWRCQARNLAGLRRLYKSELPYLIDHAQPLLAERTRHPEIPLYYQADTHWTPYGGAVAVRQLMAAIHSDMEVPPPQLSGATFTLKMDLSGALQWPVEEQAGQVTPLPQTVLDELNRRSAGVRTLISHDSFYARIESQLREAFPKAIIRRGSSGAAVASEIASADRLIVNMIERQFVRSIREDSLSWEGPIASAIMARNLKLAAGCSSFEAARSAANLAGSPVQAGEVAGEELDIRALEPQHLPCLRLSLAASESAIIEIAMPNATTGTYEPGRIVRYQVAPGNQTIGFVLPDYAAGSSVRLEMGEAVSLSAVEIGEIERPRLASALQP